MGLTQLGHLMQTLLIHEATGAPARLVFRDAHRAPIDVVVIDVYGQSEDVYIVVCETVLPRVEGGARLEISLGELLRVEVI